MSSADDQEGWRKVGEELEALRTALTDAKTKDHSHGFCANNFPDEAVEEIVAHILEAISTNKRRQPRISDDELLAALQTLSLPIRANAVDDRWQWLGRVRRRFILALRPTEKTADFRVDGLIERGRNLGLLSCSECVVIRERKVISPGADGDFHIHSPGSAALPYARISIAVILAGCAFWVFGILSDAMPLDQAMIWSLPLGYLFGMLLRKRWDSAWGHKKLAEKLSAFFGGAWVTYRNPH